MTSAPAPAASPSRPLEAAPRPLSAALLGLQGFTQPRPPQKESFRRRDIPPVQGERAQLEYISRQGFRKKTGTGYKLYQFVPDPPRGLLMLP